MKRSTTIELCGEELHFSIAHFTIFSATERERLHGHNYCIHAFITVEVQDIGLSHDYAIYRKKLLALCEQLDRYLLLPANSPVMNITEDEHYYYAHFDNDKMPFLKKDTLLLPLYNITIEELSRWFVEQFIIDETFVARHHVEKLLIKVANGPGQWASAEWKHGV